MGIFEYNGHTIEIDFMDIETLKRYEEGKNTMSANIEKIQEEKDLTAAERFEKVLNEIDNFFIKMFGANIVKQLFGKTKNLRDRMTAVSYLLKVEQSLANDAEDLKKLINE